MVRVDFRSIAGFSMHTAIDKAKSEQQNIGAGLFTI